MHLKRIVPLLYCIVLMPAVSVAQEVTQKLPETTRILFMLDGSGSMLAQWEETRRIHVAKKLLAHFVDSLRANENLEIALRVYGHQFDRRLNRCNDSKLEVPFRKENHDAIIQKLRTVEPKGNTPIAYSLEQAAGDFPGGQEARNIIIIITDGIESCDGDPCAVSLALQKKSIFLRPFIIGIGMDKKFEDAFGCMGDFYDATDIHEFSRALQQAVFQSLEETTVSVELLDEQDRPTERDVNISFVNSTTGSSLFEFVHYRDEHGKPDSVEIDPVLNYDIVVNTVPPVVKKNIRFEPGKHNVVDINSPQGTLSLSMPGHTEYEHGVSALIKDSGSGDIITSVRIPTTTKLLAGHYQMEILTLPRRQVEVVIRPRATSEVKLKQPGVVNLISTSRGIGSLYEVYEDGTQQWIANLNPGLLRNILAIQPGRYKAVFRSQEAKGSKYTAVRSFAITPGASLNIGL